MSALKPTVGNIIQKRRSGDIGLEIEVESHSPTPIAPAPWSAKEDHSLREYGIEYFTTRPISCDKDKYSIIKSLTDKLDADKNIIRDSPRTSVHVHVNILRHTPLQVWTAAMTYWLLDNILLKYCGADEREGNVFCLRLKDSEAVLNYVDDDLTSADIPFSKVYTESIRYSSQNLMSIYLFGSLEYRGMRGIYDPKIIDLWSTGLYDLVHKSKRFSDPANMLDTYLSVGIHRFLELLFNAEFVSALYKCTTNQTEALADENIGRISGLCYKYSWDKWENNLIERYRKMMTPVDQVPAEQPTERINYTLFDDPAVTNQRLRGVARRVNLTTTGGT